MKPRNIGMLLLSIYLLVVGVVTLGGVSLGALSVCDPHARNCSRGLPSDW